MGEYMPFGLLAKTPKAKTVLMGTGGASGLIDETATQTLQSEGMGTGVGVASNVILDVLALRKGNLAGVIENVIPDQKTINNAKKIQKDARKYGLNITTGEATESASILKLEGSTNANVIGNKVLDSHWKNRPQELKNYITNWGKANGLLPDSGLITSSSINEQIKKVALQLDQQRSKMWLKSGGEKFNKSFFDSQSVDNVKIALLEVAEKAPDDIAKYLTRQANAIGKSNGKGSVINKIYQDIRDGGIQSAKNENFTSAKSYEEAKNVLKELLKTNKDWVKANNKYKVFSETFERPLSKGSVTELFNDLKKGKWIESAKTNANIYKYITSPNVRSSDIQKLAKAVNKSGVKGAWENIASDFFNNAFNKAAIDNMNRGLNTGTNFYNAILKTPRNKENFTEVMYQLALTTNKNVKKSDVEKAVTSFANVLKASGAGGKVGSTTATNIGVREKLTKTDLDIIEGVGFTGIKKWFGERAYSKSSTEIAEALVSKEGIDAFIDLAQNWKNKNKAVTLIRTVTIGTDELE
jgi:predicted transcriptional regulator